MTPDHDPTEQTFPSTTWEWRRVKVARPPEARDTARRSRSAWRLRSPWNPRQKLTLQITYRGGAQAYYLVESRGCHGVFPGVIALHDVMQRVYNRE